MSNGLEILKNESQLPEGRLISASGDELAVPDKNRKDLLVWDVSKEGHKRVIIFSTKSAFGGLAFLQLEKEAQSKGYRVIKKSLIENGVLNSIYEKRAMNDSQKANAGDSVVVNLFDMILTHALSENISDIHFEVRENAAIIRMRKDGELMEYRSNNRLSFDEANNLCGVIYNVLAATKDVNFDPRTYQQAAVPYFIKDQELRLRYQSMPVAPKGYDVVLRILPIGRSEDFTPLQHLGYSDQQVEELINIVSRPVGSLIIAGVTGSGKSTTLKNLLMFINANTSYKLKIFTIEDPPEYNIAKVSQIPVVIGKDFDPSKSPFEAPIKACMRGDPDIIMIGEIRDVLSTDLMQKAIQSGHQVLSTIHTTSAIGIISRLESFKLQKNILGSPDFLTGLLYQKLLGNVCQVCAIDFNALVNSEKATKKDIELYQRIASVVDNPAKYPIKLRNEINNKCPSCKGSGIKGRNVCAEVILVDMTMLQIIERGNTVELITYWRSLSDKKPDSYNMRGKTCMEHGFVKMLNGIISPVELEQSFKPIDEMLLKIEKNYQSLPSMNPHKTISDVSDELNEKGWSNLD